jgi:hypothetical protein
MRSETGKHSKDIWDDDYPRLTARAGVSRVVFSSTAREMPCVPGSVAMREASQQSRGAYSVPALGHTILSAEPALPSGSAPPGPVVNEPDRGSFGVLISQIGADVHSAPNSGARADISRPPLWGQKQSAKSISQRSAVMFEQSAKR